MEQGGLVALDDQDGPLPVLQAGQLRPGGDASFSSVVSRRGASSTSTTVSPFLPGIVTATISSPSRPSSVAAIRSSSAFDGFFSVNS